MNNLRDLEERSFRTAAEVERVAACVASTEKSLTTKEAPALEWTTEDGGDVRLICVDGTFTLQAGHTTVTVAVGDMAIVRKGTKHRFMAESDAVVLSVVAK